jgi:hypothetical protein
MEGSRYPRVHEFLTRVKDACAAKRIPDDDADLKLFFDFLRELHEKLKALSRSDIEVVRQFVAWSEKVEATRLGGASGDPRLRRVPGDDDWWWRPAVAGLCSYADLDHGGRYEYDLCAVLKMNTIFDVVEENKRITAGDAARPQETLDLVAVCDAYVAKQRALGRNISQKGFCEWVQKSTSQSQQQTVPRDQLRAIFKSKYKGDRGHPTKK